MSHHTHAHDHPAAIRRHPRSADDHDHDHGHSHGPFVDRSIIRSRAGIKAVSLSLAVLTVTAVAQTAIYVLVLSVALLADLIHNFGDAMTAIPLGLAFFLRSATGERWAGIAVVATIFVSAVRGTRANDPPLHLPAHAHPPVVAGSGRPDRLRRKRNRGSHPQRAGKRLNSPALIADGNHARVDGFVSLGVIASAAVVALGAPIGDPIIGLLITLIILKITWDSWHTVRGAQLTEHD